MRAAGWLDAGEDSSFHAVFRRTSILNEISSTPEEAPKKKEAGAPLFSCGKVGLWRRGPLARGRQSGPDALRAPGEKVRVEIGEGVNARLAEVVEPSSDRVKPPCPLFARCGGCHYQHAPYEFQLARKVEILREQLRRVGKIEYSGEIETISGPPLGYRNRVQVHILSSGRAGRRLGYLARRSHKLVPLTDDCPVASPRLNRALAAMRARLHDARFPRFVRSLELFTNETDVQVNVVDTAQPLRRDFFDWCESVNTLDYPTVLGTFRVGPRSFFQVNRFLVEKLVAAAMSGSEGKYSIGPVRRRWPLRDSAGSPLLLGHGRRSWIQRRPRSRSQLPRALCAWNIRASRTTSRISKLRRISFSPTLPAPGSAKKSWRI